MVFVQTELLIQTNDGWIAEQMEHQHVKTVGK